eukprot:jgi/Chlat1/9262/Chrsp99S09295
MPAPLQRVPEAAPASRDRAGMPEAATRSAAATRNTAATVPTRRELSGSQAQTSNREAYNAKVKEVAAHPSALAESRAHAQANEIRQRLNKKLSDSNMQNRRLQREIRDMDAVVKEARLQLTSACEQLESIAQLAEEMGRKAARGEPFTKANGKYVHSLIADRTRELQSLIEAQLRIVDKHEVRQVEVFWQGMAQDVKVMGSFDGWSKGEQLSPEVMGTYAEFRTTLRLRPGRYHIKFVVDGDWRVVGDWPIEGEGYLANNVLVVQ